MTVVWTLLCVYLGIVVLVYAGQRWLIYPAPAGERQMHAGLGEVVRIERAEDVAVYALYVAAAAGQPTLVHFHGNAEVAAWSADLARRYQRFGIGFYAVEYPGYGPMSDGTPTETSLYGAADVALEHLRGTLQVANEAIVIVGQSLGSGVAVEMARRGHGSRLVLLSAFTSMPDMAQAAYPWLPGRWLVQDRYENLAKAASLQVPVWLVHGSDDRIIPVTMSRRLAVALSQAHLHEVAGAGHNDLWMRGGDAMFEAIVAFARGGGTR